MFCFGLVIVCIEQLQRVCGLLLSCSKSFHTSPIRAKSLERKIYIQLKRWACVSTYVQEQRASQNGQMIGISHELRSQIIISSGKPILTK